MNIARERERLNKIIKSYNPEAPEDRERLTIELQRIRGARARLENKWHIIVLHGDIKSKKEYDFVCEYEKKLDDLAAGRQPRETGPHFTFIDLPSGQTPIGANDS